jgi:hypothetical protein
MPKSSAMPGIARTRRAAGDGAGMAIGVGMVWAVDILFAC